jgi:MFS superfamily sulfate permease-like transporter
LPTLGLALATLALIVAVERLTPRLPAPLLAIGAAIAASGLLGLAHLGVQTVGHIPRGLPGFTAPELSLISQLWPAALGIALMSFTETIAAAGHVPSYPPQRTDHTPATFAPSLPTPGELLRRGSNPGL